jgi:hypothetical protein
MPSAFKTLLRRHSALSRSSGRTAFRHFLQMD